MMLATGTLYLTSHAPVATRALDGTFTLSIRAVDRIGTNHLEPWIVTWSGMAAESFWLQNQHGLTTNAAINVQLARLGSLTNSKSDYSSCRAQAVSMQLVTVHTAEYRSTHSKHVVIVRKPKGAYESI